MAMAMSRRADRLGVSHVPITALEYGLAFFALTDFPQSVVSQLL